MDDGEQVGVESCLAKCPCSARAEGLFRASDQSVQRAVVKAFALQRTGASDYGAEVVMCIARFRRVLTLQSRPRQAQLEPELASVDGALRFRMGLK